MLQKSFCVFFKGFRQGPTLPSSSTFPLFGVSFTDPLGRHCTDVVLGVKVCLLDFSSIYHINYIIYGDAVWKQAHKTLETHQKCLYLWKVYRSGIQSISTDQMDFSSSGFLPLCPHSPMWPDRAPHHRQPQQLQAAQSRFCRHLFDSYSPAAALHSCLPVTFAPSFTAPTPGPQFSISLHRTTSQRCTGVLLPPEEYMHFRGWPYRTVKLPNNTIPYQQKVHRTKLVSAPMFF